MDDVEEQTTEVEETEEVETGEVETEDVEGAEDEDGDEFAGERTKLTGTISKLRDENKSKSKQIRDLKAQLADATKPVDESEVETAKREAAAAATQKANERIAKAEVKAAAKGRFADPADVELYLDLSEFVDEDGDIDAEAIEDALTGLLEKKPHLAAASQKRFQGGGHQGAKAPATPAQLTRAQYNALSRDEKRKARAEGRVNKLIGAN